MRGRVPRGAARGTCEALRRRAVRARTCPRARVCLMARVCPRVRVCPRAPVCRKARAVARLHRRWWACAGRLPAVARVSIVPTLRVCRTASTGRTVRIARRTRAFPWERSGHRMRAAWWSRIPWRSRIAWRGRIPWWSRIAWSIRIFPSIRFVRALRTFRWVRCVATHRTVRRKACLMAQCGPTAYRARMAASDQWERAAFSCREGSWFRPWYAAHVPRSLPRAPLLSPATPRRGAHFSLSSWGRSFQQRRDAGAPHWPAHRTSTTARAASLHRSRV